MIENIKSGDHLSVFVLLVEYLSECFFKGEPGEALDIAPCTYNAKTCLQQRPSTDLVGQGAI